MTNKVWEVMNDLEMVTSKIVSAREIIDTAAEAIQKNDYDRAETLAMAAYEFLGYYLEEFDEKFKLAWNETVKKQPQYQYTATGEKWDLYDEVLKEREYYEPTQAPLSCDGNDSSPECKGAWNDFWEENYYPEEYKIIDSVIKYPIRSSVNYTDEELDAMCDKASSDEEKEKCREYNLREAEYYNKRAELDAKHSEHYYDYTRNDLNRENPFTTDIETVTRNGVTHEYYLKAKIEANSAWNDGWTKEYYQKIVDKYESKKEEKLPQETPKKKWVLPVEQVHDDYFVSFPDDLLKTAKLKEGDEVNWIDNGDGSFSIRKVHKV